jgi:hypothetical protein
MKKTIELKVPKDWSAITLREYLALRKDMDTYKDNEEAVMAAILHHLCKFPVEYVQQMDIDTFLAVKRDVASFFNNVELPLKRFVTINGLEFGFEPNLSQMAYGAYVDISKYETIGIDDKWAEIMSILYRPVISKMGSLYDIKPYDGVHNSEYFLDVTMDIHWGALFFFKDLLTDLQNYTLKYLTEELAGMHLPPMLKQILEENGKATQAFSNWQVKI